jgi:hypothetical protein
MTPPTKSNPINNQQHPRQYAPCSTPIRKAPEAPYLCVEWASASRENLYSGSDGEDECGEIRITADEDGLSGRGDIAGRAF